jgi:chromosome segregation ATPase
MPIPAVPEPGLWLAVSYAINFTRARWQRRGAIRVLTSEIKQDTDALDLVLGQLGRAARAAGLQGKNFADENDAITAVEERKRAAEQDLIDLDARKAEESSKYVEVEREKISQVAEAEAALAQSQAALENLQAQRRGLRDKRKDIERRQRAYIKAAEDRDTEAGNAPMGDSRTQLRKAAESHRKEAADLDPERQDLDRRLTALDKPIAEGEAQLDSCRGLLDSARRSLDDAREGHRHRLAEIDAEHKRKSKEVSQADAEISRRLVTLGTLVNLNRVSHDDFIELYRRIDRLRDAISARGAEIDRLSAERSGYHRPTLLRGVAVMGGGLVALVLVGIILRALL